ncbi:hypothetical protein OKW45_006432 [Paraburkholderia sp. WSM4175]
MPDRDAPRKQIRDHARDDPPGHAADRRAADVQAHCEAEAVGMHFLGEISHRDGRHAAEREPFERTQHEQLVPVRRDRYANRQHRRHRQRQRHQLVPAPTLGDETGDEDREGERGSG